MSQCRATMTAMAKPTSLCTALNGNLVRAAIHHELHDFSSYQWGVSTDLPVPGDYDGDGKIDIAAYRPATGSWFVLLSTTNWATYVTYQWGVSADIPVPADYDGDGKTDIALYRPPTGTWYVLKSSTNSTTYVAYLWGARPDIPILKRP